MQYTEIIETIQVNGKEFKATVCIPIRTKEEQVKRDEEIKQGFTALYRKMSAQGRGHLLTGKKENASC